jgi:hypothetical protein
VTRLSGVLRREVTGEDGKSYMITLTAEGITMREKGRRTTFGPLSYSWLHFRAVSGTVEAKRRVKRSVV